MDNYYRLRNITNERYDIFDKKYIRILNISQASFYMLEGVELWDCYPSRDKNTNKPIAVFVFVREETKDAYDKWCNNKQGEKNETTDKIINCDSLL